MSAPARREPGYVKPPKPRKWLIVDDGPMTKAEKRHAHNRRVQRTGRADDYSIKTFRFEGATTVATIPADECAIVGHKWLPERLHTRWCRVCKIWEAL